MSAGVWLVATAALLLLPGFLPTLAASRRVPAAVATAPLATALLAAVGGTVAVATRTSVVAWVLLAVAAANAAAVLALRRDRHVERAGWLQLVLPLAALVYVLLALRRAPTDWDARSIWFFHAQWFWAGGAQAADALGNPAFVFSQPDYPPLVAAVVGTVWRVTGGVDPERGQLVVGLLNGSALLAIAVAVGRVCEPWLRPRRLTTAAGLAGGLIVLGAAGISGANATNGYGDLLWGASFVAGSLVLLLGPTDRSTVAWALVPLATAMLTKNEGMLAGLPVLALALLRCRRRDRLALLAVPVVAAAAWAVVARLAGAESYLATSGRTSGLLRLDPEVTSRLGPTLEAFWTHSGDEVLVGAVVTAGAVALLHRARRQALVAASLVWCTFLVLVVSLVAAYLISPYEIGWHLGTSIDRTTIAPRLWLLAVIASALIRILEGAAPEDGAARTEEVREPGLPVA
jgi:hypothetical protein